MSPTTLTTTCRISVYIYVPVHIRALRRNVGLQRGGYERKSIRSQSTVTISIPISITTLERGKVGTHEPRYEPQWIRLQSTVTMSIPISIATLDDPRWARAKVGTIQGGHDPRRARVKLRTSRGGHEPRWARAKVGTIQIGHEPRWHRAQFGSRAKVGTSHGGHS